MACDEAPDDLDSAPGDDDVDDWFGPSAGTFAERIDADALDASGHVDEDVPCDEDDVDALDEVAWDDPAEVDGLVAPQPRGGIAAKHGVVEPRFGFPMPSPPAPPVPPAAGSSSDAPRPPAGAALVQGPRSVGTAQVFLPGGKVTFYERGRFVEIVCNQVGHGKCVLTRKVDGDKRLRNAAQGRPLGLAVAWLAKSPACATKAEHWALDSGWPTLEERRSGRSRLQAMQTDASRALLAAERQQWPGEDSEPELCP